jgi:hypothetical protein
MHELCLGSGASLPAPPVKQRSVEQQAHLSRLQDNLDNQAYAAMVADITVKDRSAEEMRNALLPTFRWAVSARRCCLACAAGRCRHCAPRRRWQVFIHACAPRRTAHSPCMRPQAPSWLRSTRF